MKIAFMFPGQGSQTVGMGKDIYERYNEAKEIYEKASEILNMDVAKLCFEGEQEELNKTKNAQIAILVTSLAILEVLKNNGVEADICTGLSLGEYTALIYSGYLSFEDGIKLIQKRGYYMGTCVPKEEFKMAAVIGAQSSIIEKVCENLNKKGMFVVPANYNYSGQTVISGNKEAVEEATKLLNDEGIRKIIELKTSGPFHTEKLLEAKQLFEKELEKVSFMEGKVSVIKNIDGSIYTNNDNMKEILAKHIVSPVRFDKAIKLMEDNDIDTYIEIGPGRALSGFVKKENKEANVMNVCDIETLNKVLEYIKESK